MKNRLLLICILCSIIFSCSTSKREYKYLSAGDTEISRIQFRTDLATGNYLEVLNDSLNEKKLIERQTTGKIEDPEALKSILSSLSSLEEPNLSRPITIIYYPGKDPCNTAAFPYQDHLFNWFSQLEQGILEKNGNRPLYLYKNEEGLEKYNGIIKWKEDPDQIFEKQFFTSHYPCFSFVVISPQGNYIAYYGEFGKERVWNAVELLK